MPISHEQIQKIGSIFSHLQLVSSMDLQKYNPDEEYRKNIIIGKGVKYDLSATEVYCHAVKMNNWHFRIWQKRHQEIPHASYCEWIEDAKLWRLGFKS